MAVRTVPVSELPDRLRPGVLAVASDDCAAQKLAEMSKQYDGMIRHTLYTADTFGLFLFGDTLVAFLVSEEHASGSPLYAGLDLPPCTAVLRDAEDVGVRIHNRCSGIEHLEDMLDLIRKARSVLFIDDPDGAVMLTLNKHGRVTVGGLYRESEFGLLESMCSSSYMRVSGGVAVIDVSCALRAIRKKIEYEKTRCP